MIVVNTLLLLVSSSCLAIVSEAWVANPQAATTPALLFGPRIRRQQEQQQERRREAAATGGTGATVVLQATSVPNRQNKNRSGRQRPPSRVSDPDGSTPDFDQVDEEEVDPETIDGLREIMSKDELPRPIPHQPWRLGTTDGCEDPIDAEWRQAAEQIIETSVKLVGGQVLDVTWYLTQLIVTLDENITVAQQDLFKSSGPVIEVEPPEDPLYKDPNEPNPEDILDPDEVMYQRQTEEEAEEEQERNAKRWASKDADDPPDEPHNPMEEAEPKVPLYMNDVGRIDVTIQKFDDDQERYDEAPKPIDVGSILIDTAALSTIAGAILEGLEEVEDELNVLTRHELVLTSPGAPDVLETQKQFNAYRGSNVIVETQDPWESNRTLKGKLVDRNSMDLIINQKGRMVTIPLCFVKCVRIPRIIKNNHNNLELMAEDDEEHDPIAEVDELVAYDDEPANGSPMP